MNRLRASYGTEHAPIRLSELIKSKELHEIRDDHRTFYVTDQTYRIHREILDLVEKRNQIPAKIINQDALDQVLRSSSKTPDDSQIMAIHMALTLNLCSIKGGPGTGKSFTLNLIAEYLRLTTPGCDIRTAAFSARLARATAFKCGTKGMTLHALTKTRPGEEINGGIPIDKRITNIQIDETFSMTDIMLNRVLVLTPLTTPIILAGDPKQILPIGNSLACHDLVATNSIPNITLTSSHRTGKNSHLTHQIRRIENGHMPRRGPGLEIITITNQTRAKSSQSKATCAAQIYQRMKAMNKSCIVLCPDQYGDAGHANINKLIAGHPTPELDDEIITIAADSRPRAIGEEPRWINGEKGIVTDAKNGEIEISFDDGKIEIFDQTSPVIALGYAMSGHRGQGLEYDTAVIILESRHIKQIDRQYLTSVLSRAPQCWIIADPGILEKTVAKDGTKSRPHIISTLVNQNKSNRHPADSSYNIS